MSSAPTYGVGDFATELAADAGSTAASLPGAAAGAVTGGALSTLAGGAGIPTIASGVAGGLVGGIGTEAAVKSRLSQALGVPGAPRSATESLSDDARTAGSAMLHGAGGLVGGGILGLLLDVAAGGHGHAGAALGGIAGGLGGAAYGGISKRKEIRDARSAETHAAANKAPKKSEPKADSGKKESKPEPKKTEEKSEKTSAARVRTVYDLVKNAEDETPKAEAPKGDAPGGKSLGGKIKETAGKAVNEVGRQAKGMYEGLKDTAGVGPDAEKRKEVEFQKATMKRFENDKTKFGRSAHREAGKALPKAQAKYDAVFKGAPISRKHPVLAALAAASGIGAAGYGASRLIGSGTAKEAGAKLLMKRAEGAAPEGGAPKGKAPKKATPKVDEPITETIKRSAGNVYNNVSNEVKRQASGLYSGLKDAFGIEPDEIGKAERLANQSAMDVNKATQKVNKRTWTDAQRASIDKRLLQERAKAIYNRGLAANARLKAPIARRHPLLTAGLLGYGALNGISSLLGGGAEKEAGVSLGRLQKAAAVVERRRTMQKEAALRVFGRAYQLLQTR